MEAFRIVTRVINMISQFGVPPMARVPEMILYFKVRHLPEVVHLFKRDITLVANCAVVAHIVNRVSVGATCRKPIRILGVYYAHSFAKPRNFSSETSQTMKDPT